MSKNNNILLLLIFISFITISKSIQSEKEQKEQKITGIPISSDKNSTLVDNAFDDDLSTEFVSSKKIGGWIGLELDSPYRITKVGWSQKSKDKSNYLLGIFEGANDPSFIDAVPLTMITDNIKINKNKNDTDTEDDNKEEVEINPKKMNYILIDVNLSFKYLRYLGPYNKSCVISSLEFYGYEVETNNNSTKSKTDKKLKNEKEDKEDKNESSIIEKEEEEEKEEKLYQPSNLPLIVIHTEDSKTPIDKINEIKSNIMIISSGKSSTISIGTIRLRGNSTIKLIKKPFQITFSSSVRPLNMKSKSRIWRLIANYADKTLLRNSLSLEISSLLEMRYTLQCEFVDLMLNGEFLGNYNLCDSVEGERGRVELDEMDSSYTEEPEITGGYLIEISGYARQEKIFGSTEGGSQFKYKYPRAEEINEAQKKYIQNKLSQVQNDIKEGILDDLDQESFIKYMFVQEVAANVDTLWSNYLVKERGDDKIYWGPIWDYDLAFGNDQRLYPIENVTNFVFKYASAVGGMKDMVLNIFSNEQFLEKFKKKWKTLRKNGVLDKEKIWEFIDKKAEEIKESRVLNFIRWDALIRRVKRNPQCGCNYENEIKYLKNFVGKRLELLDEMFENANVDMLKEKVSMHFDQIRQDDIGRIDPKCLEK